jgi:cytochrome d ubiquinol oxidase subunit II
MDAWLPVIFLALMGVAMLAYVVLDGYDLGVGMWLPWASDEEKDMMIASIGPFWDANETWLVLGVGILLVAFPVAHGIVLTALYLPVAVMLVGLILRGVAFDFRVKAHDSHKPLWNRLFFIGSMLASAAQGWMLGAYITGFQSGWAYTAFALGIAVALPAAYLLMGAAWLIMKTDGELQAKAVAWGRRVWLPMTLGIAAISLATPVVSRTVFEKWFSLPETIGLAPIPLMTALALGGLWYLLRGPERVTGMLCWAPFALTVMIFLLAGLGLAYSIYPYVVMDRLTVWQAASEPAALRFVFVGVAITVPAIVGYTIYVYRVFRGKAAAMRYA